MSGQLFHRSSGASAIRTGRRASTVLATAGLLLIPMACGDDEEDDAVSAAAASESAAASIDATLKEFKIALSATKVAAGAVTINAINEGTVEHELVIIKSDLDSGALPQVDGLVPEDEVDAIDEIAEFGAGTTETATFDLAAGDYILICNIPAHYGQGMHVALTVEG